MQNAADRGSGRNPGATARGPPAAGGMGWRSPSRDWYRQPVASSPPALDRACPIWAPRPVRPGHGYSLVTTARQDKRPRASAWEQVLAEGDNPYFPRRSFMAVTYGLSGSAQPRGDRPLACCERATALVRRPPLCRAIWRVERPPLQSCETSSDPHARRPGPARAILRDQDSRRRAAGRPHKSLGIVRRAKLHRFFSRCRIPALFQASRRRAA
jgi:hypothetical protein